MPFVLLFGALFLAACQRRNGFVFCIEGADPDGLLREAVSVAVQRWRAATGLDVSLSEQPTMDRIRYVSADWMQRRMGSLDYGALTEYPSSGGTLINVRSDFDWDMTHQLVTHEMAHVFTNDGTIHSRSGVFAPRTEYDAGIDESVLDLVCSHVDCSRQHPERSL